MEHPPTRARSAPLGEELPLEAAVTLPLLPLLFALLFEPRSPLTNVAGAAVVIGGYTLITGFVVHLGADLASSWLKARGVTRPLVRLLLVEALVVSGVTVLTLVMLPGLSTLCHAVEQSPLTLLVRGVVMSSTYVAVVFAWGQLRGRYRAAREEAAERQERARVAELRAEQTRANPHFFRNTLGLIAELIHEDPDLAERTLLRLGDLYRYALEGYERELVPLGEEAAALDAYLAIQAERHAGRLTTALSIPDHLRSTLIPPLLLQPLVENAIHHGLGPGSLSIAVEAKKDADAIVLVVDDDGRGGGPRRRGTGTGLASVRERLRLAYGERATLQAGPKVEGDGFLCTIRIPCAS